VSDIVAQDSKVLTAVVEAYLFASSRGQITRGFATVRTSIVQAKTGLGPAEIIKAVRDLGTASCIVHGQMDAQGLDVCVTAIGLGRFLGGK